MPAFEADAAAVLPFVIAAVTQASALEKKIVGAGKAGASSRTPKAGWKPALQNDKEKAAFRLLPGICDQAAALQKKAGWKWE